MPAICCHILQLVDRFQPRSCPCCLQSGGCHCTKCPSLCTALSHDQHDVQELDSAALKCISPCSTCSITQCCNLLSVHHPLVIQVAQDMKKLSKVKPKLPWSPNDTKIKKPKPAGKAGGKPAGFGAKR